MKISQVSEYSLPAEGGLPPLQAMIYEELKRRPDEVFEYQGDSCLCVRAPVDLASDMASVLNLTTFTVVLINKRAEIFKLDAELQIK